MVSLYEALKTVVEICGDERASLFTELPLRLWENKGIISPSIKIKDGKIFYPDIILAEILTAIRLRKVYQLEEIVQARNFLEFNCSIDDKVSTQSLVKFMSFQKRSIEKKSVIKNVRGDINDIKKTRNLTEQLHLENRNKEVINDYFNEFLKAKKEGEKYYTAHNY